MTEEKDKIAKLEERLEKAAATFKEMKAKLESTEKVNEGLANRVAELEDELTLNGGAVQEVEGLKGRLEKAKEIFTTQKAKIAELTEAINEKDKTIEEVRSDLDAAAKTCSELSEQINVLNAENATLKSTLDRIREIVGE